MPRTNPASQFDTNNRIKANYRSAYSIALVERARRAGVPGHALEFDGSDGAWYTTLVVRCDLLSTGKDPEQLKGWPRVRQLEDYEAMIRLGLSDHGIAETTETGQLVPRLSGLHSLIMRQRDNRDGIGVG